MLIYLHSGIFHFPYFRKEESSSCDVLIFNGLIPGFMVRLYPLYSEPVNHLI